MGYSHIERSVQVETVVKKSRFIARCVSIASREEAMAAVDVIRLDFPDARHHCWAYLLGDPTDAANAGASDDGEPSGTAGKPILNVISHSGIGDVIVLVTRYFGGIKLGAGGLVRAYSGAASELLDQVVRVPVQDLQHCVLELPFAQEQTIRHWLNLHGGDVDSFDYQESVKLSCRLPRSTVPELRAFCRAHKIDLDCAEE